MTKLKSTSDVQTQEQHDLELAVASFAQKSAALTQGKVALSNELISTRDKHQPELTQLQPQRDNALTDVQKIAEFLCLLLDNSKSVDLNEQARNWAFSSMVDSLFQF